MALISIIASLVIAALLCLFLKKRVVIEMVSLGAAIIACGQAVTIAVQVSVNGVYNVPYFSLLSIDALGAIPLSLIGVIGCAATFYSIYYLREETKKGIIGFRRVREYFVLLNLFHAAMVLALAASNPVLTWICIEATTLSTAFLISFYNKPSAIEAAWKYLVINSVGLLLAFFGTLLYATSAEGADMMTWSGLIAQAGHLDPSIAKIAFIFIIIGYGTKVGLFPMYPWLPDAHSKAPPPISALLSGVLLNVAFIAVLRFKLVTDTAIGESFTQNLFIAFGILSIFFASFIIFTQKNYKRLLAYSSIENMGIMTLGFGFGGIGAFAALLHMVYHALLKSVLFLCAGSIFLRYSSTKIINIRGAFTALPLTSSIFFAGLLALTGAPPFGIFLTKIGILSAGIAPYPFVVIIALFCVTLLFIGFFKHGVAMVFGEKPSGVETGENNIFLIVPPLVLIAIALYVSIAPPHFLQELIAKAVAPY